MATTRPPADRGGTLGLLERYRAARDAGRDDVLALVASTTGSSYRKAGALALLDATGLLAGALSGGCLEPELERRARLVLSSGRAARAVFDTQADSDRVLGSGLGCRGSIEVVLLPLPSGSRANPLLALLRGLAASEPVQLRVVRAGQALGAGEAEGRGWRMTWGPGGRELPAPHPSPGADTVSFVVPPPPSILVLGAGPETPFLVAFARRLGWSVCVVEGRRRFSSPAEDAGADEVLDLTPEEAFVALSRRSFDAALVTSHSFHGDLEHLRLWSGGPVPFIGLLGPTARRDELLAELGPAADLLAGRLHAPLGLPLFGRGPEAIALAIVAQLQQRFAADDARSV